ncbi:MAG: hypothetical protein P8020_16375, partial [Acidobacteriota bacterium]
MPEAEMRWRLQGGFSQLLEGSHIELLLESRHAHGTLETLPYELLRGRGTVNFKFRAARTWRARGPAGLTWELSPEGRIEAKLLCSGSAFLGNFRVPEKYYGVQWTVVGRVTGSSKRKLGPSILQASTGSWINYTWVDMAAADSSPKESMLAAWAGFRDLFDCEQILLARSRQVCQLTWTGRVRMDLRFDLDLVHGWQIGKALSLLELETRLRTGVDLALRARLEREGTYSLRVQRKERKLRLTLRRQESRDRTAGIEISVFGTSQADLGLQNQLLDPVLSPIRDRLDDGLKRRFEVLLAIEASQWDRRKSLVETEWTNPTRQSFLPAYRGLLEGTLPLRSPGLKTSSLFETLRGRRTELKVNFLNWFTLGSERTREHRTAVRVDPAGDLVVEEGWRIEETRYRWDERQFFKLLAEKSAGSVPSLRWLSGEEGRFSHRELLQALTPALHVGAIKSVSLPAARSFPLNLVLTWITEINPAGVAAMRRSTEEEQWGALVRSKELAEPDRYRPGSFWRDWIESPGLRHIFDRNPVQSHLQSVYPVGGRSDAERLHVIAEYRRVRSFLQLFAAWAADEQAQPIELARKGLNVPIFLFAHLLCPTENRRSVVVMTGGIEAVWGDTGLV